MIAMVARCRRASSNRPGVREGTSRLRLSSVHHSVPVVARYNTQVPIARPELPGWCVYQFEVRGVPFYVGIGRTEVSGRPGRASDRLRWVCSQIKRELERKPVKWRLHGEVFKYFILKPAPIEWRVIAKDLPRKKAPVRRKLFRTVTAYDMNVTDRRTYGPQID